MKNTENLKCLSCGKKAHNFEKEEAFSCIPPKDVLKFGQFEINENYRQVLYQKFPFYNTEEVVGSYLGNNPHFPSQSEWLIEQEDDNEDEH